MRPSQNVDMNPPHLTVTVFFITYFSHYTENKADKKIYFTLNRPTLKPSMDRFGTETKV